MQLQEDGVREDVILLAEMVQQLHRPFQVELYMVAWRQQLRHGMC